MDAWFKKILHEPHAQKRIRERAELFVKLGAFQVVRRRVPLADMNIGKWPTDREGELFQCKGTATGPKGQLSDEVRIIPEDIPGGIHRAIILWDEESGQVVFAKVNKPGRFADPRDRERAEQLFDAIGDMYPNMRRGMGQAYIADYAAMTSWRFNRYEKKEGRNGEEPVPPIGHYLPSEKYREGQPLHHKWLASMGSARKVQVERLFKNGSGVYLYKLRGFVYKWDFCNLHNVHI